jgi:hAT family C-terminal dimerisation region
LRKQFDLRFSDFKKVELLGQFVSAYFINFDIENLSSCIVENFQEDGPSSEMELIEFLCDLSLKSVASTVESVWPFVPTEKYPILVRIALKTKALFCSTYLCESTFSTMKVVKSKYRNIFTDVHLDNCIRMGVTRYSAKIEKNVEESECHYFH